jgi:hypothetical protein
MEAGARQIRGAAGAVWAARVTGRAKRSSRERMRAVIGPSMLE